MKKETKEEESTSTTTTTASVSKQNNTKQKKIQSKKTINSKLEKVMTKIDERVKNSAKNLQLKNIIKMDVMIGEQLSLAMYENVEFYKPKTLYLDQIDMRDNRLIYADVSLGNYIKSDIIGIKKRQLEILDNTKQRLLIELEELKRG